MVLSPEKKIDEKKTRRGNLDKPACKLSLVGGFSAQERLLKEELKLAHRAELMEKGRLQMFDGLPEGIGLGTVGRFLRSTQQTAQSIQTQAEAMKQMVTSLQGQKRTDRLRGAFDRSLSQKLAEQLPEERGSDRVARENVSHKEGESASAAAALAAIGTKDTLPPGEMTAAGGRIVAVKEAVPV